MSLAPLITDARFTALHSDPRFSRNPSKGGAAVSADSRFRTDDPRFRDAAVSRKAARPRDAPGGGGGRASRGAGRKQKRAEAAAARQHAPDADGADDGYAAALAEALGDEDDDAAASALDAEGPSIADEPVSHRKTVEEKLARLTAIARGEAEFSDDDLESSEEESAEEGDIDDAAAERIVAEIDGEEVIVDPDAPDLDDPEMTTGQDEETSRLAVVGLDWSQLRAVDVHAVLQSALPSKGGGSVTRVTVYPSDYGLKRMAEEARDGPLTLLRASAAVTSAAPKRAASQAHGRADDAVDPRLLRQYELNKLKYFYAIAEFDRPESAVAAYEALDGLEFEASSNVVDLRFVPNDVVFKNTPRDVSTDVPATYEPPQFSTRALQSSKVELTWEADDSLRSRALQWEKLVPPKPVAKGKGKKTRKGAKASDNGSDDGDELHDLKAYLASESSEEDDVGNKEKAKNLRALLLGGGDDGGDIDEEDASDEDGVDDADAPTGPATRIRRTDTEQSITVDLTASKALAEKARSGALSKDAEPETPWEAFTRKRKEKRKALRANRKAGAGGGEGAGSDDAETGADALEDDGFFAASGDGKKRSRKVESAAAAAASAASAAELGLLTMDDAEDDANYDLKTMLRAQKKEARAAKRSRSGVVAPAPSADPAPSVGFSVSDARFAAAHSNPEFSIDPNAAAFKDTPGMRSLLRERLAVGGGPAARASRPMVVVRADAARPTALTAAASDAHSTSEPSAAELAASVKLSIKTSAKMKK